MRETRISDAYEYCHQVTRRASKTFYWGSLLLPPAKRRAIWAVYALFRVIDDLVDETGVTARRGHLTGATNPRRELDYWRRAFESLYFEGSVGDHPVLIAWDNLLTEYLVPAEPVRDLFDGVEMDLTQNRYQRFADLSLYCYRVAGTVGIVTSSIFGFHDKAALSYAQDLGTALQLTNILRDIGEDACRNRIYLPQEEMAHFHYSESDLMAGIVNEAFCDLVRFQIARVEDYYRCAHPGIALLNTDCRLAVSLSSHFYRGILQRIQANRYDVFTKRASVPLLSKLGIFTQLWLSQHAPLRVGV